MLEIDYSLITLTVPEQAAIRREVEFLLKKGVVPPLDKANVGRVVVVNPSAVQTVHHIPDGLRTYLRRIMVATTEGPASIPAARLIQQITESDENLFALVVELHSEFPALGEFLSLVPELRRRYPDAAVFLTGPLPKVLESFQRLLAEGGHVIALTYPDSRGTVELDDPAELSQMSSAEVQAVTFGAPFFSQIRVVLKEGTPPIPLNIDTLRRLHGQFGHGEIREIDLGGGRKEKEIVIDLPLRVIRDVQFRQDRGLEFHGVIRNGLEILSRNFEKEKLEYRWVPLRSLDGLIRRVPGQEVQKVMFSEAKVMRVNCFDGQISFLDRLSGDQISLQDVQSLAVRRGRAGVATVPGPADGAPAEAQGTRIDRLIVPSDKASNMDPMQQAVQEHYYARILHGDVQQRHQLETYTRRLSVAAVGPLAGQIIKLLRRYGLERLIDARSFHYLCDGMAQVATYYETPARFKAHFRRLVSDLRELADLQSSERIRLGDINHEMHVVTEWIDAEQPDYDAVSGQEFATAYRELELLTRFIAQEFQRSFDVDERERSFFERIQGIRQAALMCNWLGEAKLGNYGLPLPDGRFPDFVFFGTAGEKGENDRRYFFPGLACAELFTMPGVQALFDRIDYGFSVFLEEQLALADHLAREQGSTEPTLAQVAAFLDGREREAVGRVEELRRTLETINLANSPEYQRLLKAEEEDYYKRYRALVQEQDTVARQSEEADKAVQLLRTQAIARLEAHGQANLGERSDGDVAALAAQVLAARQAELDRHLAAAEAALGERAAVFDEHAALLVRLHDTHREWQQTAALDKMRATTREIERRLPERLATLRRIGLPERESHMQRVEVQAKDLAAELENFSARIDVHAARGAKAVHSMAQAVATAVRRFQEAAAGRSPLEPRAGLARLESQARRLAEFARTLAGMEGKVLQDLQEFAKVIVGRQRYEAQLRGLEIDREVLRALAEKRQPVLPDSFAPPAGAPEAPETARQAHQDVRRALQEVHGKLRTVATLNDAPELVQARAHIADLEELAQSRAELVKVSTRKRRLEISTAALAERHALIEAELADLPRRVQEKFMPARKELLLQVFIPEEEVRLGYYRTARALVHELLNLQLPNVRKLYLDRAVFRRFISRQFRRGAYIAVDHQHSEASGLQNVHPAAGRLVLHLQHNFARHHPEAADTVQMKHFMPMEPGAIAQFVRDLVRAGDQAAFDYVMVPGTFELKRAVALMNEKDRLTQGIPRPVLVYVGKYATAEIMADPKLREDYFRALKHNVVLNIDGVQLVDNPDAIASRLLQETLGSASDTPDVEEIPEEEHRRVRQL
ncbi:MAG: hypothetical protein HY423_12995 [Candidatus Lambdaproteobacteria bacterium]|nr:hypothetical protein [Candidatus Lambdaproteobacteria bacterium]